MKELIRLEEVFINEVKQQTVTFTVQGVQFLQENDFTATRVPSAETKYIPSGTEPNLYCMYYKPVSGTWSVSAFLTNAKLAYYMQLLLAEQKQPELKSDVISDFAKKNRIPVVDIKVQQPTEEQLQQAIDNIAAKSYIDSLRGKNFKFYRSIPSFLSESLEKEPVPEINSGGACDYYRVGVTHPMSKDQVPYIAECGDIMESLEMTYAEANMFKEIWRTAAERTLGLKKAGNSNVRAAEKVKFFADRYYQQNVHNANLTDSRKVTK